MIKTSFRLPSRITSSICPTRIQSYSPSPEPTGASALNKPNVLILHPSGTNYCTRTSGFSSVGCIAHRDALPLAVISSPETARWICKYRSRRRQFALPAKEKISEISSLERSLSVCERDGKQAGWYAEETKGKSSYKRSFSSAMTVGIPVMHRCNDCYISHSMQHEGVWTQITQHTWGVVMKWAVAMVIRRYTVTELRGHKM